MDREATACRFDPFSFKRAPQMDREATMHVRPSHPPLFKRTSNFTLYLPFHRPFEGSVVKCGCADCVCELEGLDIHSCEPILPPSFFLVVKRKIVHAQSRLDLRWIVPHRASPIEEGGIERTLQSMWCESAPAGTSFPMVTGLCVFPHP